MGRRVRQPKLSCRLARWPDRCGEQKLAQAYRTLVPESKDAPAPPNPEWIGVEHETCRRPLR